jgi:NRPS condensation-like uncharacterized protein
MSEQVPDDTFTGRCSSKEKPITFESYCIERVFAAIEAATGNSFYIHIVARLAGRIDETQLVRAIRLTLDTEPAFRCTFEEGWFQPYWKLRSGIEEQQFFEFIEAENEEESLQEVLALELDRRRDSGIKTYLIRKSKDTLCVKLDHKVGDGHTGKQFMYRLAETYSRLAVDPQYTPPAQPCRNRSVMQVTRSMSVADQHRVLHQARLKRVAREEFADWYLPRPLVPDPKRSARRFHIQQVPSERFAATVQYAHEQGVTLNTVLLAAFARAAINVIPRSSGTRSEIQQTVDLRRHLPEKDRPSNCNLSSMLTLTVDQGANDSLETYVAALGAQMDAARKDYIGLAHPLIRWELNRKRRFLFNCIPFRVIKRTTLRRIRSLERAGSPSRLVFSNVGKIDPDPLIFANVRTEDAYFVSGILMNRELLILLATEFGGRLFLTFGYSPHFVDGAALTGFLEEIIRNLPA